MTYLLELEMPGLPKSTNGAHGHWRAAAAERKKWRTGACLLAKGRAPAEPLKRASLKCTRYSSAEPDYDNLSISFKSVIDGLKDAGVIADDKSTVIVAREYLWAKASPKAGKIRVEVREAE